MRNIYIGIVVILVIAGIFVLVQNSGNKKANNSTTSSDNTSTTNQTSSEASSSGTITYSDSGFSPSTLTIKAGGQLTVTNSSSSTVQFDSEPHPIHTDNNELNIGTINAGESKTVTLNKTGDWGYHNHLDSGQKGRVTVK